MLQVHCPRLVFTRHGEVAWAGQRASVQNPDREDDHQNIDHGYVGGEGQRFVDDFDSDELIPLAAQFLKGAHIVYAHSVLQQQCGISYVGNWARSNFDNVIEKNEFFRQLGQSLNPKQEDKLAALTEKNTPEEIHAATD